MIVNRVPYPGVGYPQQNNFAGIFRFKIDSPLFVSSGVIVSPQLCIHRGVRCPQRGKYKNSPVSASPGSHLEFFSKLNTFATPFKWSIIQKQLLLTLLQNDICFLFEKLSLRRDWGVFHFNLHISAPEVKKNLSRLSR